MQTEINAKLVKRLLDVVDQGLCSGVGNGTPGHMCVEAAASYVVDGDGKSDMPSCVHAVVRRFKIALNDKKWSSEQARALGMREVAVAQLGSLDIDPEVFVKYVVEQTIRRIVPIALRAIGLEAEAVRCEQEGTCTAVRAGQAAANKVYSSRRAYAAAAYAAYADAYAAYAAAAYAAAAYAAAAADAAADAYAADAADADADAADAAAADAAYGKKRDEILTLSATIAAEALKVCGAAGAAYLHLCNTK